jgi:hypothetical protein
MLVVLYVIHISCRLPKDQPLHLPHSPKNAQSRSGSSYTARNGLK